MRFGHVLDPVLELAVPLWQLLGDHEAAAGGVPNGGAWGERYSLTGSKFVLLHGGTFWRMRCIAPCPCAGGSATGLSATEKERIVAEANNELTKAVTEHGLSVEEYTSILQQARDDSEVRRKILQYIHSSDK